MAEKELTFRQFIGVWIADGRIFSFDARKLLEWISEEEILKTGWSSDSENKAGAIDPSIQACFDPLIQFIFENERTTRPLTFWPAYQHSVIQWMRIATARAETICQYFSLEDQEKIYFYLRNKNFHGCTSTPGGTMPPSP